MMRLLTSVCVAVLLCAGVAQAQLVTYNFQGNTGTSDEAADATPAGVSASSMTRTGVTPVALVNTMNSSGWGTTLTPDTSKYYSFTVTATGADKLNLTSLNVNLLVWVGGGAGPTRAQVYAQQNGAGSFDAIGTEIVISNNNINTNVIALTGFTNLDSVAFRIVGYGAGNADGEFALAFRDATDPGVELFGTVPEPTTMLLTGLGMAGVAGAAWRRRRKAVIVESATTPA